SHRSVERQEVPSKGAHQNLSSRPCESLCLSCYVLSPGPRDSLTAFRTSSVVADVVTPGTSKGDLASSLLDFRAKVLPSLRRISISSFCVICINQYIFGFFLSSIFSVNWERASRNGSINGI